MWEPKIGVIEDNCSTDNYITHQKGKKLKLVGVDVVLEIEGINSTKVINSKIYQVPIRDVRKKLHYIEELQGPNSVFLDNYPQTDNWNLFDTNLSRFGLACLPMVAILDF